MFTGLSLQSLHCLFLLLFPLLFVVPESVRSARLAAGAFPSTVVHTETAQPTARGLLYLMT